MIDLKKKKYRDWIYSIIRSNYEGRKNKKTPLLIKKRRKSKKRVKVNDTNSLDKCAAGIKSWETRREKKRKKQEWAKKAAKARWNLNKK